MAFTKKEKNFILKNYSSLSISKISEILNCSEKQVSEFLISQDLKVSKEPSKNKNKIEKFKESVFGSFELKSIKQVFEENKLFFTSVAILVVLLYLRTFNSIVLSDEVNVWADLKNGAFNWINLFWGTQIVIHLSFLLFGDAPWGSRLITLVLHLANIFLFFVIFRNFISEKILKVAVVLLSVHSLFVEPITWVAANPYVLQGFIYLLIMYFSLLYERTNKIYFLLPYFYFVLALVLTGNRTNFAPILAICFNLFVLKRSLKKELIISLWLVCLIPVYTLMNRDVVESRIASLTTGPFLEKFIQTIPFTTAKSLELVFFPINLALFHEETLTPFYYSYARLLTVFFFGLIVYLFFKKEKLYFGLVGIACAYCLYIFSPVQVAWFVAERYMYLSVFIVCIFLALLINYLNNRFSPILGNTFFIIYFLIFLYVSYFRFDDWSESTKLWEANTKISPDSYRVRNNLAEAYSQAKRYDKAEEQYLQAVRINGNFVEAYFNLSNAYIMQNKFSQAESVLFKTIQMNPTILEAYLRLAIIKGNQKDFSSARNYISKAKEIEPNSVIVKKFEEEFNKYEAQQKN